MKKICFFLLMILCLNLFADTESEMWDKISTLRSESKYLLITQTLEDFLSNNPNYENKMDIYYSISCHYALAEKKEKAFEYLHKICDLGFNDFKLLNTDTDFNSIKNDKNWKKIQLLVKKNYDNDLLSLSEKHNYLSEFVLPQVKIKGNVSVEEALFSRRSVREYKQEPLSIEDVSQILWSAYGVTKTVAVDRLRGGLKTAPSAGATYPLEIYLYINNVDGLEKGFYHYSPQGHKIMLIKKGDYSDALSKACMNQSFIKNAPISLIYSAVFDRTTRVYGERGRERYVAMDLGHSAENVYLQAEAMNFGTVAIGAFYDLMLQKLVQMTRNEEPLYVMPVGKKM